MSDTTTARPPYAHGVLSQLGKLSRPLSRFVRPAPPGRYGSYIPHYVIGQVLLAVVGPYTFEHRDIIRGTASGVVDNTEVTRDNVIVGVVCRLTCTIDGRQVSIDEIGEVTSAHLNVTDGARLKKATSDALKRAAMRLGVGLHLWCKHPDEFFLANVLLHGEQPDAEGVELEVGGEEPDEVMS